jgi:methylated-DNA-protein-cysteine methyltransferase-like protein
MANCPDDAPWQRVVMADGSIAGGSWAELRRAILMDEGVPFLQCGRVDMKKCTWDGQTQGGDITMGSAPAI